MNKVPSRYKNRISRADVDSIKKLILSEAHDTAYSIHPAVQRCSRWYGMKRAKWQNMSQRCDTCRRVKAEHRDPQIPEWKWEEISMDFIVGLPVTRKGYNSIRVVVDRLTKVAHFIPVNTTYSGARLAELYISRILHDSLDSKLRFRTAYHPRTMVDGKNKSDSRGHVEGMCYTIRNQLGIRVRLMPSSLITTTAYQASPKKSPFEAPYGEGAGHRYFGTKQREKCVFGPDLIKDAEQQIKMVRENLRVARLDLCDVRRRDLTFKVDDFVYLKVSPMRGIRRFNMKGKPAPRYIGPFKIVERKGEVAYKLELPPNLSRHTQCVPCCLRVPEEQAPPEGPDVQEDLTYTEHPVKILETSERVTRNRRVKMCRVQSGNITRRMRQLGKERRS
ncbi:LOW QUALITY PROTEIN: hypothetical protein U9M48_008921 [Paspalum notatum var. saurae]|uniref:Tf2-1-like SH3-like domain-containing protein n=1 Tax=Paspalum notatum var. saurae TaxID=547442 RepID=A0AAQ3SQ08_PASNO